MTNVVDFQWRRFVKSLEEVFKQAAELSAKVEVKEPSNVTDISELLEIRKLQRLPPEMLRQLAFATEEAEDAFAKKDYNRAADIYGALIASEHFEPAAGDYFPLAFSLYRTERIDEAISVCHEVLSKFPEKIPFYALLGDCYAEQRTLEGLDNARYCNEKTKKLAQTQKDYATLLKVALGNEMGISINSFVIKDMKHNYHDRDGKPFSYNIKGYSGGLIGNGNGEVPTLVINGVERETKSLSSELVFPVVFRFIRERFTDLWRKPVYFAKEILGQEGIGEEEISYRYFELGEGKK